jgi:hypothetical protein
MQQVQQIDIHVDGNTKVTVQIEFLEGQDRFGSEAVILDSKADPGKPAKIHFGSDHGTASKAFEAAFYWIAQWSAARDLPIIQINNPGFSDFLSVEDQVLVARRCGLEVPVTGSR